MKLLSNLKVAFLGLYACVILPNFTDIKINQT